MSTATLPKNVLCIMDRTGDTKYEWSPDNPTEVAAARDNFNSMRGKGFVAYAVDPATDKKGRVITEFDPHAGRIIMSAPMAGG